MSALSNYLENKIIDWLFRAQTYSPPADLYIALFTAGPTEAGGGTEMSGGDYARVSLTSALTAWNGTHGTTTGASTGTGGTTSNADVIQFATPIANWGTATHFGIYDAASGGNLLVHGALAVPKVINTSDDVRFNASALTIQIDD